jgi:hypothetical protein
MRGIHIMDLKALDRWITSAPEYQVQLITQDNFSEWFGDDLLLNELTSAWNGVRVGWSDYDDGDNYGIEFTNFYRLDEDGEILVDAESFDENQARIDAHERALDRELDELHKQCRDK